MNFTLRKLGPGILFAGAAIGVSHLVQSTRAGADFGFGLIWALILINLIKFPFFQFGTRYTIATGHDLLLGFKKLGTWVLGMYFVLTFLTMFTIQTAVTIVTAGIATSLFGFGTPLLWAGAILGICFAILLIGRFRFLDRLMKIIVLILTISTFAAVVLAFKQFEGPLVLTQIIPESVAGIAFLIAFMCWMPAPLDLTVWQSIWTIEKKTTQPDIRDKEVLADFKIGYIATVIIGLGFLVLGALIMNGTQQQFASSAGGFANDLIQMYTSSLGDWSKFLIGMAALTTMFSTTLTTLDASPRVMQRAASLLFSFRVPRGYLVWLIILILGTFTIYLGFTEQMGTLIKIATIVSFLSAPFYAIVIHTLVHSDHLAKEDQPSKILSLFSLLCIFLLIGFSFWYITTLF